MIAAGWRCSGRLLAAGAIGLAVTAGGCDDGETARLKADYAALQAKSQKLADELAAAKAAGGSSEADTRSLMGRLADATANADALLGRVAAVQTLADTAQAQYGEAVKKVGVLEGQAKQLKATLDKTTADASLAADAARAQLADLKKQMTDAAAKLIDTQNIAAAATAESESLRAQVADLTRKVADLTQALKAAQGIGGLLGPGQPPK